MTLLCPSYSGMGSRGSLLDSAVTQAVCEPALLPPPCVLRATESTSLSLECSTSRMGRISQPISWVVVRVESDTACEVIGTMPGSQQVLRKRWWRKRWQSGGKNPDARAGLSRFKSHPLLAAE